MATITSAGPLDSDWRTNVASAGTGREVKIKLPPNALELIGVGGCLPAIEGYVRPQRRVFFVECKPRFGARFVVKNNCINRACLDATSAIDTFARINDEHILALLECIDGADFNAVHVLALDTSVGDYRCHAFVASAAKRQYSRWQHTATTEAVVALPQSSPRAYPGVQLLRRRNSGTPDQVRGDGSLWRPPPLLRITRIVPIQLPQQRGPGQPLGEHRHAGTA